MNGKTIWGALAALAVAAGGTAARGAVLQIDLLGKGGPGLLSTNENGIISGGPYVGGEVGPGIFYDDVTNVLTLNFSWAPGSGPGFTGLSGNATAAHIHGPTSSGGPAGFLQNVGVLFTLSSGGAWNANAATGGFSGGTFVLTAPQEADLLAGKYYINVHTAANPGGEMRGQLVVIPETSSALLGLAGCGLLLRRRR